MSYRRFARNPQPFGEPPAQRPLFEERQPPEDFNFAETTECQIFDINTSKTHFTKVAFLANFRTVTIKDEDNQPKTALMLLLYDQSGEWLTAYVKQSPYFLLRCAPDAELQVIGFLEKRYEGRFASIKPVDKIDLETLNHLSGQKTRYLKLSFGLEADMAIVRADLAKRVDRRRFASARHQNNAPYASGQPSAEETFALIEDIKEHDIPYSARVCIDNNIRVSFWYTVSVSKGQVTRLRQEEELLEKPEFSVLAFDIETTKLPLKFPDPRIDGVILISYVIDGNFFLIVNREIVGATVDEFVYSPKPDIRGPVTVYNEENEKACLLKFCRHVKAVRPLVVTTFNGDFFDIPFLQKRCEVFGLSLEGELGWVADRKGESFSGKYVFLHLDCYYWVKRDAFLPQGSQGLKAVTKAKLGYNPIEVDPEEIVALAQRQPQRLCEYSVSDAVATYFLYLKHIHDFIFALCTIVPMAPDEVLRRGSGSLCENLLMAEAHRNGIVFPNRKLEQPERFFHGHLIEAETYVGGYVECLNNGAYRADIKADFSLSEKQYEETIENVGKVLEFFVRVESGESPENVTNLREVREQITQQLTAIAAEVKARVAGGEPVSVEPLIYHVDVASMYPNIILTNRLQPTAIVSEQVCSNCLFNESRNKCKRELGWDWKATYFPLSRPELEKLKCEHDRAVLKPAIKQFCQKHYKCQHKNVVEYKENTVCMRENPFYVDTIRAFRDRRYKYKELAKAFGKREQEHRALGQGEKAGEAAVLSVLYESLQLAHKIILNSFYGYVMKKGARWYSMEMAGMVTYTGAKIIQAAKQVMDALGRPLELDTDGIWTLLPRGFPERFALRLTSGRSLSLSFICSLLNWSIFDKFKNDQYQELRPGGADYALRSEMTIFFEIDGPYKAMIIPAAREENKKLKKRYVVFNFEGKIAEVKGFEIKRRGELGIIKVFQAEIFGQFLKGGSLKGLYEACSETARRWVAVIREKGAGMEDSSLIELLGETKVLSRNVEDYGVQKGIALTAAKRLAEFLGPELLQGKGLNCHFVIARKPESAPLNERVIPISIFFAEEHLRNRMLKRWTKVLDPSAETLKSLLDWDYYMERLVHTLQKIIIIPAILQGLDNPMPEVAPPEWLRKRILDKDNKNKQSQLSSFFAKLPKTINDIESLFLAQKKENKGAQQKSLANNRDGKFPRPGKVGLEIEEPSEQRPVFKRGLELEGNEIGAEAGTQQSFPISALRKKWLQERNRKRTLPIDKIQMTSASNLQLFGQKIEQRIKTATWVLTKISASPDFGVLVVHAIIDGVYQLVRRVRFPVKIYVNSLVPEPSKAIREVKKRLPREKQVYFLYEYELEERSYKQKLGNINQYLANSEVEGVYETGVPLEFRGLVRAGAQCKMDPSVSAKTPVLEAEGLVFDLEGDGGRFFRESIFDAGKKTVFVWNAVFKGKLLTVVFSAATVWIFKLQAHEEENAARSAFRNHFRSLFLKKCESFLRQKTEAAPGELLFKPEDTEFVFSSHTSLESMKQALLKAGLEIAAAQKHGPVLCFFSAASEAVVRALLDVWGEIPWLRLAPVAAKRLGLSSLDWHVVLADRAVNDFLNLNDLALTLDQIAQYCRVPLCNLTAGVEESVIRCIDVLFARELERHFYVWWYSAGREPDLGTRSVQSVLAEDQLPSRELQCWLVRPAFCPHYVFEVFVSKMHFSALAASEQLWDSSFEALGAQKARPSARPRGHVGGDQSYYGANRVAFKVIGELFVRWYQDVLLLQNPVADLLIQNLVRWMCSGESRFFDPLVKHTLDKITKRVFERLVRRLEELGARVLFASPFKILVDTQKASFQAAANFMKFVLQSIVKEEMFAHMSLRVERVFKALLFYGVGDYAGLLSEFGEAEAEPMGEQRAEPESEPLDEEETLSLVSQWKSAEFLPEAARGYFARILEVYVQKYSALVQQVRGISIRDEAAGHSALEKRLEEFLVGEFAGQYFELMQFIAERQRIEEFNLYEQTQQKDSLGRGSEFLEVSAISRRGGQQDSAEDESVQVDDFYDEEDSFIDRESRSEEQAKRGLGDENEEFAPRIFPAEHKEVFSTPKKARKRQAKQGQQWMFPQLIGRSYRPENVALEMTKIIFEVISKDSDEVRNIVLGLRSNILSVMKINEFADEAKFRPLIIDFWLSDITCEKCYLVRNINVFADFENSENCWKCVCGEIYSNLDIERKLIDFVNACFNLLVNQEKFCLKCKQARTDFFSKACYCGGNYARRVDPVVKSFEEEMRNGLANLKALASAAGLTLLADLVSDLAING